MARQYCTFYVGDLFFGVEVERIQEVIRYQDMTPVPLAPHVVRGLINLRGQIVTAIDLRRRLEIEAPPVDPNDEEHLPMNVVIRTEEGVVSFLVDEIGDVLEVEDDVSEAPPETLTGVARELIRRVYKLEGQLLLVLDAERTLEFSTVAAL